MTIREPTRATLRFFVGLHQVADAARLAGQECMISVNRLRDRKSQFVVGDWIMDSGAFSTLFTHGTYPSTPEEYAAQVRRWASNGNLEAAVTQDWMCEPIMLEKTGLDEREHQRRTIERYDAIRATGTGDTYLMPVLQGYSPDSYVRHLDDYGDRLDYRNMWVGVGSVCKRNSDTRQIEAVLIAIKQARPDLCLHGFGLKTTALVSDLIPELLYSADSMAWSYAARREGRNANDWREARDWAKRIRNAPKQYQLSECAWI